MAEPLTSSRLVYPPLLPWRRENWPKAPEEAEATPALQTLDPGPMANARDTLMTAYDALMAARQHKEALLPERMKTLKTDPEFTEAVAREYAAHLAFDLCALAFCKELKRETAETDASPPRDGRIARRKGPRRG
jgi:hypothetical protein